MQVELAGLSFRPKEAKDLVATLVESADLALEMEADNPYDPYAVRVIHPSTEIFIGYVPRNFSAKIFCKLEMGKRLSCRILTPDPKKPTLLIEDLDA